MSRTLNNEVRDFVTYHFAREFVDGLSVADAAVKLRSVLPGEFNWAVNDVEGLFTGARPPRAYAHLGAVLQAARAHGVSSERAFAAYEASARDFRAGFAAVLAGATTIGAYLIALAALLLIVIGVYTIFVLPQMRAMFEQFGAALPEFTQAMMGNFWFMPAVMATLMIGLVLYLVGLHRLKRRLYALQPMRPLLRRLPGLGNWARGHDLSLWMRYFAIMLDAGAGETAAAGAASQLTGPPESSQRERLLVTAGLLGRLRPELARMLEDDARSAIERFEQTRNAVVTLVRMLVYFIISAYLIAMYLPIFKLGAVV